MIPNHKISGIILSIAAAMFLTFVDGTGDIKQVTGRRAKRNVAQLALLIDDYTPYSSNQLIFHGNWCGFGGNRARDGSVRDPCDACCKSHDLCYDRLLRNTRESVSTVADGIVGYITDRYSRDDKDINKRPQSDWTTRSCFPYVDTYDLIENRGPYATPSCDGIGNIDRPCAREVCKCDTQFASCLRNTRCRLRTRTIRNLLFY